MSSIRVICLFEAHTIISQMLCNCETEQLMDTDACDPRDGVPQGNIWNIGYFVVWVIVKGSQSAWKNLMFRRARSSCNVQPLVNHGSYRMSYTELQVSARCAIQILAVLYQQKIGRISAAAFTNATWVHPGIFALVLR